MLTARRNRERDQTLEKYLTAQRELFHSPSLASHVLFFDERVRFTTDLSSKILARSSSRPSNAAIT